MISLIPSTDKAIAVTNVDYHIDHLITKYISSEYIGALIFFAVAIGISVISLLIPFLIAKKNPYSEKLSSYECGFESIGKVRDEFNVQFYLVAILFIIFDLEVAFLFPWAVSIYSIGKFGFWSMMVFLGVLTIGFIYEWKKGALDWK